MAHEWQHFTALIPRRLITGETGAGELMRRRAPDGTWQYRRPSETEADEWQQAKFI